MDLLKRKLAPITKEAWEEINEEAKTVFILDLSVRKFADVEGPFGIDMGGVPTGRLEMPKGQDNRGLLYGIHEWQPLIEVRIPFKLNIWELDNIERGAKDIDLDPLVKAAKRLASFEEKTIYDGLKEAKIDGLKKSSVFEPVKFPLKADEILHSVAEVITKFKNASIEGPYNLVLDTDKWEIISSHVSSYPLRMQLEQLLEGSLILAPNLKGAFVVSNRGGDFKLTLGMDISIGYEGHDQKEVQLFFTEAFTFRVLDDSALVAMK